MLEIINNIENKRDKDILYDYFIENMPIKEICIKHKLSDKYLYKIIKQNNLEKRRTKGQKLLDKIKENKELFYYLLGLIASDGYVYKKKPRVEIDLIISDSKVLEDISFYLYGENTVRYEPDFSVSGRCRLFLYGKEIVDEMYKYGITQKKSETLSLNIDLFGKDYFNHFLRGYIDGDGSIQYFNDNYITIRIDGNKDTIQKICNMVDNIFTIKSLFYKNSVQTSFDFYRWQVCKNKDVREILNYIYKEANFYIQRKYDSIKTILN